jgi:hypothetical protein
VSFVVKSFLFRPISAKYSLFEKNEGGTNGLIGDFRLLIFDWRSASIAAPWVPDKYRLRGEVFVSWKRKEKRIAPGEGSYPYGGSIRSAERKGTNILPEKAARRAGGDGGGMCDC